MPDFRVYQDYENGFAVIDPHDRTVLEVVSAYHDAEKYAEWVANALNTAADDWKTPPPLPLVSNN